MSQARRAPCAWWDYNELEVRFNSERTTRLDQSRVRDWLAATAPFSGCRRARGVSGLALDDDRARRRCRRCQRLIEALIDLDSADVGRLAIDLAFRSRGKRNTGSRYEPGQYQHSHVSPLRARVALKPARCLRVLGCVFFPCADRDLGV